MIGSGVDGAVLSTPALRAVLHSLPVLATGLDEAERVDRLRLLEELKAAAAAAQALEAVALDSSRRVADAASGVASKDQGRGVSGEVGLALRMSPHRASRWLGWAKIVTTELPATFAELAAGRTTEWRANLVARETAVLSREHRALADAELAPKLEGWGDRKVETETRAVAYRLDPAAAVERARNAASDRRVTIRPAPDTMCRLGALVPVVQGVACYTALRKAADSVKASGDARSRDQIMADTLVERVTGQATADGVAVEVELIITDEALMNAGPGRDEPARLVGHGPIPAGVARDLVLRAGAPRWLRRLYTRPGTGELMTMDTHRRTFTDNHRRFLRLRDDTCRTPWCNAPIRHADHVKASERGGVTSVLNGQGLCEQCNYLKQARGRITRAGPDRTIITSTPTGHAYASRPPDLPGQRDRRPPDIVWHRAA